MTEVEHLVAVTNAHIMDSIAQMQAGHADDTDLAELYTERMAQAGFELLEASPARAGTSWITAWTPSGDLITVPIRLAYP